MSNTRLTRSDTRCERCGLGAGFCICDALRPISCDAQVLLIRHKAERLKTTNSGRLVARCLTGARMVDWGAHDVPWPEPPPDPADAVLLFPASEGRPRASLEALVDRPPGERPLFVVLDGTWKQTRRMARRVPGLAALPRLELPPAPPSEVALRRQVPGAMNTAQAVARLLIALGESEAGEALAALDQTLTEHILKSRGLSPEARAAQLRASTRGIYS